MGWMHHVAEFHDLAKEVLTGEEIRHHDRARIERFRQLLYRLRENYQQEIRFCGELIAMGHRDLGGVDIADEQKKSTVNVNQLTAAIRMLDQASRAA